MIPCGCVLICNYNVLLTCRLLIRREGHCRVSSSPVLREVNKLCCLDSIIWPRDRERDPLFSLSTDTLYAVLLA